MFKFNDEVFEKLCDVRDDYGAMALAYYIINSDKEYELEDFNTIADAFMLAIEGNLEVDIKELLKERGLMTEDGRLVEE